MRELPAWQQAGMAAFGISCSRAFYMPTYLGKVVCLFPYPVAGIELAMLEPLNVRIDVASLESRALPGYSSL